jgi:hypothetical protein
MSRGILDGIDVERISQETPDLSELEGMVLSLTPDVLSISSPQDSDVPIASVCFNDALNTLQEARYALFEVFAHQVWYVEKKDPPDKMCAAFFGRFYADDAALRLYSAGEHLANGIIMMLEIADKDLKPYKDKGKQGKERVSQQLIVGNYLRKKKPIHPITQAVNKLVDSKEKEWYATINYRNRLVHEQPPTVKGLGIVYERKIRWEPLPTGKGHILRGGGDKPEYSVNELVKFIKPAMFQFIDTFTSVIEFYIVLLKSRGVSITFNETSGTKSHVYELRRVDETK